MAVRHLEGVTRSTRGTPREVNVHTGSDLKKIVSSHTRRHDSSTCADALTSKLPQSPNTGDGWGHGPTRIAHRYGYSLPILNEHTNLLLKFKHLELGRDSGGRHDERGAREDSQHERRFSNGDPARSPGRNGATSRLLKRRDDMPLDESPCDELLLQCHSMPLSTKNPENCSRQMAFNPKEKYYDESVSGARSRYAPPSAHRCRPRYAPGRMSMWDHSFSGGGDVARSHFLTHLSDPFHRPSGSRRSFVDPGQQKRVAVSNKKAWGASNYSEPIGSRAFTYIDRVLRWLRKVPGNPLVNWIDCEGMSQDTTGLLPQQAFAKAGVTSRLSQPGSAWLQPCRTDLTWSSQPQNLPNAVLSPQRSTPHELAARSPLYRPFLSPAYSLLEELDEGRYEKFSADGQFYPLNLIPSISQEKIEDGAHFLNRSPCPPYPSPRSTKLPSSAGTTPRQLTERKYRYSSDEELSFNSAECTHDVCSVNEIVSPEPLEPPEPKLAPAKALVVDVQPIVSVRYRKQKQVIKTRPATHRRLGMPSRRVPRHIVAKKKPQKANKEYTSVPTTPLAKSERERKPRRASKKKKKTNGALEVKKCIRLLKRKSKKRCADESEFVLRDLSPPSVSSSEYSLTVVEAFQRVLSMTAEMKVDVE